MTRILERQRVKRGALRAKRGGRGMEKGLSEGEGLGEERD